MRIGCPSSHQTDADEPAIPALISPFRQPITLPPFPELLVFLRNPAGSPVRNGGPAHSFHPSMNLRKPSTHCPAAVVAMAAPLLALPAPPTVVTANPHTGAPPTANIILTP